MTFRRSDVSRRGGFLARALPVWCGGGMTGGGSVSDIKSVHVIKHGSTTTTITEAKNADYFGVPCLVGKATAATPGHWVEGATAYAALSQIQAVVVFASL